MMILQVNLDIAAKNKMVTKINISCSSVFWSANMLTFNDNYTCHATLAVCYQFVKLVLKIARFCSSGKGGIGRDGLTS